MNFKKITALGASLLMTGMTAGFAAAATVDKAFTDGVAVVYGDNMDMAAATSIKTMLADYVESTGTMTTDGESFNLYDSDNLHFGDAMNAVMDGNIDDNDLEVSLADGSYDSGDIDVDFEQYVTVGTVASSLIVNDELNDEDATLGYYFDDSKVLDYTLSFKSNGANVSLMADTHLPLFGKDYYVLEATTTKLTLLDSAERITLAEGETVTVNGKKVFTDWITDGNAKIYVNDVASKKLADGQNDELDDGTFIVVHETLYRDNGGSSVDISIGEGKVILENGEKLEANIDDDEDLETIEEITVTLTESSGMLTDIVLDWDTDGEAFLTEGDSFVMPVFEQFTLSLNDFNFGSNFEDISIDKGETLVLNMGNFNVDVMHNDTVEQLGNDKGVLHLDATNSLTTQTFYVTKNDMILGMVADDDKVEQFYYKIGTMVNDTDTFTLDLLDLAKNSAGEELNGKLAFETGSESGDDLEASGFKFTINGVFEEDEVIPAMYNSTAGNTYANGTHATSDVAVITIDHGGVDVIEFDKVASDTGLIVELPAAAGVDEVFKFYEANEDGELATVFTTETFNVTVDYNSDNEFYAKIDNSGLTMVDETADNNDVSIGYTESYHAIKVMEDTDADTLEIEYHPDAVTTDLVLTAGGEVTMGESLGAAIIADDEAATSTKKLVVVGGSCVNAAAATLLGGAYCGEAFTEATGVGANQFIVKGYADSAINGKLAVLVAGYEQADTTNAATFFTKSADMGEVTGEYVKGLEAVQDLA